MNRIKYPNHPEQYLPTNLPEWRLLVRELIAELRNPQLSRGRGHLYARTANGHLTACIEGVVNEMAVRGRVHATWTDLEIQGPDDQPLTVWEILPTSWQHDDTVESSNRALPEALLYHGFDTPDGNLVVNDLDYSPEFIREVINEQHGIAFGADTTAMLNDSWQKQDVNPLHAMADILENPHSSVWHGVINHLADRQPANPRS